jgi:hypothetical protein
MEQAWVGVGRSFVDADEWSKEPGKAFGHTLANVGALAAGGEGIAARGGEAAGAGLAGDSGGTGLATLLKSEHVEGESWQISPRQIPPSDGWANAETLADHFERHSQELPGATTPERYIEEARGFHKEAVLNRYPAKVELRRGVPRLKYYDEKRNRFLTTEVDSSVVTYFKPKAAKAYWDRQDLDQVDWTRASVRSSELGLAALSSVIAQPTPQ